MLRVLTLNVGSLFEANWDQRRDEAVAWIDRLGPDAICLQEVWSPANSPDSSTAHWIADHVADDYHVVFGGHELHVGDRFAGVQFGSAILSRWPIDEHHVFRLPLAPDPEDTYLTAMPWELVHARTAGIDVFTTHLAAAPSHGRHRRVQVQAIDSLVREIRGDLDSFGESLRPRPALPPVLAGDFNAEPQSDEIRFLRGFTSLGDDSTFWQDAWATAGEDGAGLTQDWQTHPLAASLNVHRKRIDYVFVGDPFMRADNAGRVVSARVVADKPLTGIQASDHAGLFVEIRWPGRPG